MAQNDYRAKEAREILAEAGINAKTDERNLVTLPQLFTKECIQTSIILILLARL